MEKLQILRRLIKKFSSPLNHSQGVILLVISLLLPLSAAKAEFGSIIDIGLAGDLYLTNPSANNGQGFVNLLIQNNWSDSQLWIDLGAGGLVGDTASSYVKVPQLYYRMGEDDKVHLIVGRAKQVWSEGDEYWNMGLTQPIFRWNEAMPEQQGLTGLFLKIPFLKNQWQATLFGSYLFIPTQGPTYELINGRLTSSNPWFSAPVEVLNLSGQKANLNFDIDIPKTQDVVFKESFGFQVATAINKKDFLFNVFYLNKPKNDLMLPFEGVLNLSTFNGDITVKPQVARHQLAGLDLGWNFTDYKTVFSWIYESEVDYDPLQNTTYPILPEQNVFSLNQLIRLSRAQRIWIAYINVDRDPTRVGGVFQTSNLSAFAQRNRYEEAIRVKWEGLLYRTSNQYQVQTTLAYNQSIKRDNMWLSADINWSVHKGLELFTHCDFFGGSEKTIVAEDFISGYQNNDRCLMGGHYAF